MNHKVIGCARINAQNRVLDYDFPFQPGLTPMDIGPPLNQESRAEENLSAMCISSPIGDVESRAEGDNNPTPLHMSPDLDHPNPSPTQAQEKRIHNDPNRWQSVLLSDEDRSRPLDPKAPPFVPRCFPVDKPTPDGFSLVELDRQHISPDNWG